MQLISRKKGHVKTEYVCFISYWENTLKTPCVKHMLSNLLNCNNIPWQQSLMNLQAFKCIWNTVNSKLLSSPKLLVKDTRYAAGYSIMQSTQSVRTAESNLQQYGQCMTKDRLKTWYYAYCTHTHPFNGPLSGTTRVSRYHRGKTNVDFTEARDSEWQWHQLGHMQVCTSLQADNHTSTPPLCFFTGRMPFLPSNQQRQSTEGNTAMHTKCRYEVIHLNKPPLSLAFSTCIYHANLNPWQSFWA